MPVCRIAQHYEKQPIGSSDVNSGANFSNTVKGISNVHMDAMWFC